MDSADANAAQTATTESALYVPIVTSLDKIYTDVENSLKDRHEPRFKNLKRRFKEAYGADPHFYCRAPGRVNIIGEHIDYCGYSVLPAAIEQDFVMAYAVLNDGEEGAEEIQLANLDKDQYPPEKISTDPHQKFYEDAHQVNYFLCGYKAILAHD